MKERKLIRSRRKVGQANLVVEVLKKRIERNLVVREFAVRQELLPLGL